MRPDGEAHKFISVCAWLRNGQIQSVHRVSREHGSCLSDKFLKLVGDCPYRDEREYISARFRETFGVGAVWPPGVDREIIKGRVYHRLLLHGYDALPGGRKAMPLKLRLTAERGERGELDLAARRLVELLSVVEVAEATVAQPKKRPVATTDGMQFRSTGKFKSDSKIRTATGTRFFPDSSRQRAYESMVKLLETPKTYAEIINHFKAQGETVGQVHCVIETHPERFIVDASGTTISYSANGGSVPSKSSSFRRASVPSPVSAKKRKVKK